MIPRTVTRPNILRDGLAVLLLIAIVFAVAGCGSGTTVQRGDLYDSTIGLDYGYACDTLYIDDACTALYGGSYYESGKKGYGKKRVKYKVVKSEYVLRNQSKIATYKTKAAENAKKAAANAKAAAAAAKKSAASKPKSYTTKSSGSSFKSSSSSRRK